MAKSEQSTVTGKTYYFPWVRKGMSNRLSEIDRLGCIEDASLLAKQRPLLSITTEYNIIPPVSEDAQKDKAATSEEEILFVPISETKDIQFISPGDIAGIDPHAVLKVTPHPGSEGFAIQYYPYIEFWEPDFLWRYTPAAPNGNKLRPWLALLVCEKSRCLLKKRQEGESVSFIIEDNDQYEKIFPYPEDTWKSGHAQGFTSEDPVFCRLLALRARTDVILNAATEYYAFLVPAFETGRLRGLGFEDGVLQDITAQAPAWEKNINKQKEKHPNHPFDFPIYYSWSFKTGEDSFDGLVEKLKISSEFNSDIKIDVTRMGEGLDYNLFKPEPKRKIIGMPAATQVPTYQKGTPFPLDSGDEKNLYDHLKELLSYNPVFLENRAQITGQAAIEIGNDDPWVVPPVYGGKHIMATSIDEADNKATKTPWFTQLNLDIHNRAVAGLGKKTVQIHQEEFVNRAWKQVEIINVLNNELYQRLLSINTNKSLKNKTFKSVGKDNFTATMMQYFGSMKNARVKRKNGKTEFSLSSIMTDNHISQAFASTSFQFLTEHTARVAENLDPTTLMENIANRQIFRMSDHILYNSPSIGQLSTANGIIYLMLLEEICKQYLAPYFNLARRYLSSYEKLTAESTNKLFSLSRKVIHPTNNDMGEPTYIMVSPGTPGTPAHMVSTRTLILAPISHFTHYRNYFGGCNTSDDCEIYERIGDFVNYGVKQHRYYGYAGHGELISYSSDSISRYIYNSQKNLLGIDDDEYRNMFGDDTIVTRIGGENGLYFVPKRKLKETLEQGGDGIKFYVDFESLIPLFNMRDEYNGTWRLQTANRSVSRRDFQANHYMGSSSDNGATVPISALYDPRAYSLMFTPFHNSDSYSKYNRDAAISSITNPQRIPLLNTSSANKDNYMRYHDEAMDFLTTTPDYITLDLDKIPEEKLQRFDTLYDYSQFLLKRSDNSNSSGYLKMWLQLDGYVKQLEQQQADGTFEDRSAKKQSGNDVSANSTELFRGFEENQSEADKIVRQIMTTYYAEFFTNKELIDKYLDELLHSKFPILAYPIFPEPVYYYLKMFSDKFILPCVDELPPDSVAIFESNPQFEEAYLCGMNTEMGRELLWREYPTDQRGSYFRKFWDSETDTADIRSDNFFDIDPVHKWEGNLGENHPASKIGLLIFAIKGTLMKQYPRTQIFLHKATGNSTTKSLSFDPSATEANSGIIQPVIQAFLKDDILIVGFKAVFDKVIGNPSTKEFGYFLTFKEEVEDLNFQNDSDKDAIDSAKVAEELKNDPTLYGKHLSLFIIKEKKD